jgi:hypothetical protein
MSGFWGVLATALKAGFLALASLWEARARGRAEAVAEQNARAAEAERRAAEIREKSRDDAANDLDRGNF